MTRLDDPVSVATQYASEDNLRARQALYEETNGPDARELLRDALRELAPRHVVEVGGGPGELAEWMRSELGADVDFVDVSPRMVDLASARGIRAQVGDVQHLPFADATFDVAVAAWMLYHVPDLDRGLAELARVLRPGGTLVSVTNSTSHLRELRDLVDYPAGSEESFSRENGAEHLSRHFSRIERRDADVEVIVRDRAKLVAYRDSMQIDASPVPEDVPMPFVTHALVSIFVAQR